MNRRPRAYGAITQSCDPSKANSGQGAELDIPPVAWWRGVRTRSPSPCVHGLDFGQITQLQGPAGNYDGQVAPQGGDLPTGIEPVPDLHPGAPSRRASSPVVEDNLRTSAHRNWLKTPSVSSSHAWSNWIDAAAPCQQNAVRMKDLRSPKLIWLKGILFLIIALTSAGLLWAETPTLKTALLLALAIWAFCRAYYFAFYVLERYVDPQFRFAGLWSVVRYILQKRNHKAPRL